tara:strand:- start:505 stop:708 length:204 start_codon:yes stop_codon:yes gene_type:complete
MYTTSGWFAVHYIMSVPAHMSLLVVVHNVLRGATKRASTVPRVAEAPAPEMEVARSMKVINIIRERI